MLEIIKLKVEDRADMPVTDESRPRFSFGLESSRKGCRLKEAVYSVGPWKCHGTEQSAFYDGPALSPRTRYTLHVTAQDCFGETARASMEFETGKLDEPWRGRWITHPGYRFRDRKISPKPMRFRKGFHADPGIVSARLYCTALGIYHCTLNGKPVGDDYLTPGFTSYHNQIQYQTYDVTKLLRDQNRLLVTVAGGWAVGSYTYFRRNRIYARRQAFLAELHLCYADGRKEQICTDESWYVTMDGRLKSADLYDGEVYDARYQTEKWQRAAEETLRFQPQLKAQYGEPVRVYEHRKPVSCTVSPSGELIYDFGQNFAGLVSFTLKGHSGQTVRLRHGEILMDGELFTEPLRTAKQEIVYTCAGRERETYCPRFCYMGFRYVGVKGAVPDQIELTALGLSSDLEQTGSFSCSDQRLNRLSKNIYYSARSNFMDIPTDCPQRDERLGWTGDMALFASTASFLFDTSRFYRKWLKDLRSEQGRGGGFPMVVPSVKIYNQWEMCIAHAVDHWGDAILLLPWAEYLARGDIRVLKENYDSMRRYYRACRWWSGLGAAGEKRYIWKLFHHYGDWCAPDTDFQGWMHRGQWTATACMANAANLLSRISRLVGRQEDAEAYAKEAEKISAAYRNVFLDENLRLKKEFQTAYVLPLYYRMFPEKERKIMAGYLADLVKHQGICTGFPGTPYLLFALADNGYADEAFETLLSEKCPSWLYEVRAGATTLWERWDALKEDGSCNQGSGAGMVSFNHFAPGAVGDFLFRRIAGIESLEGGYRRFRIAPIPGGGLRQAQGTVETPYGIVRSRWDIEGEQFTISVSVPAGTNCELRMPDGSEKILESGNYQFTSCLPEDFTVEKRR